MDSVAIAETVLDSAISVSESSVKPELEHEPVVAKPSSLRTDRGRNKLSKTLSSTDVWIRGSVVSCSGQQLGSGWRMARASFGFPCSTVPEAAFFEFTLTAGGNARVGWSRVDANVDANVGFCKFSYGYRDVDGSIFHESKGRPYGESWGIGDVIGCLIWQTGGDEFGMSFYKNGIPQPKVPQKIQSGIYYPSVSLYSAASGTVELGPNFAFPPPLEEHAWVGAHALDGTNLGKVFVKEEAKKEDAKRSREEEDEPIGIIPASSVAIASFNNEDNNKIDEDNVSKKAKTEPEGEVKVEEGSAFPSDLDVKLRCVTDDALLNVSLAKTSFWKD